VEKLKKRGGGRRGRGWDNSVLVVGRDACDCLQTVNGIVRCKVADTWDDWELTPN